MRRVVVNDLRDVLARDDRRIGGVEHPDGLRVRLQFTLQGTACRRAREWFDPLCIGDHVVQRRLKPTMAKLYTDRIAAMRR